MALIRPHHLHYLCAGGEFNIQATIAAGSLFALVFTLLALSADGLFIETYLQDLRFVAATAASVAQHGAPHVALVGPVGQANSWPYAPFVLDGVFSAKDILHANLLFAWVAAVFSLTLLSKLAQPWTVMAVSLIAFLVACSPRENMTLYEIGHLAPYNRWGWAVLTPLAFYALAPKDIAEKTQAWRAALAGLGLFLLLFLKVTYFGAACLIIGAATLLGLLRLRAAMLSVLVCAIGAAVLELATGSIGLYLHDIVAALGSGGMERASRIKSLFRQSSVYGTLFITVLWLFQPVHSFSFQSWWRWILEHFRAIAAGAAMIGAALIVLLQNHHPYEAALLSASPFLALEFARRDSGADMPKRPLAARVGLALVCLVGLVTPTLDVLTLARHSLMSHRGSVRIAALADTPWADLRIPRLEGSSDPMETGELIAAASAYAPTSPPSYLYREAARIAEAVRYLQRNAAKNDIVFSYYHADEFPLLLGLAIPLTNMQWWDYGRTFSENQHIAPKILFANTTIFLEPRVAPYLNQPIEESARHAWLIYGDHIRANFTPTAELEYWRIWRRMEHPFN
jgi:hypothetical protein